MINWPDCNRALVALGGVTLWLHEKVLRDWRAVGGKGCATAMPRSCAPGVFGRSSSCLCGRSSHGFAIGPGNHGEGGLEQSQDHAAAHDSGDALYQRPSSLTLWGFPSLSNSDSMQSHGRAGMAGITNTRMELTAAELRAAAGKTKDGRAARRMLVIALVLEGVDRTTAAQTCGMSTSSLLRHSQMQFKKDQVTTCNRRRLQRGASGQALFN